MNSQVEQGGEGPVTKRKRRKCWAFSTGEWGTRVRAHEDTPGSILYISMKDTSLACGMRTRSLGHRDKERAKDEARTASREWAAAGDVERTATPTLGRLLQLYLRDQTPTKVDSEQQADHRRAAMWLRVLGDQMDVRTLSSRSWNQFIADRRTGALSAEGNRILPDHRRPVRDATVAGDLIFLNTVLNFATKSKIEGTDQYLLESNPARGLEVPKEKNPFRPVASHDRFEAILSVADQVPMLRGRGPDGRETRSYLSEVLQVVQASGRRISAVLALRYQDLHLDQGLHGKILWPAESDKMRTEHNAPLSPEGRKAIDRVLVERPGIGGAYLFPDPADPTKPVSRYVMDRLLIEAEKVAGVPKHKGSLWHAYRRKWGSERKHLSDVDVAAAGGWKDLTSLKTAYQQPDEATMQLVVDQPRRLREVKPK